MYSEIEMLNGLNRQYSNEVERIIRDIGFDDFEGDGL